MGDLSRGITFEEGQVVDATDLHNLIDTASLNPLSVTADKLGPACITTAKIAPNAVANSQLAQANAATLKGNLTGATANISDCGVLAVNDALTLARIDVAIAAPTLLGAAASNYVRLTGTANVTGFDNVAAGIRRTVVFQNAVTLVYNATSLILPWLANYTTAAGDTAEFISEGSGNWRLLWYSQN